MSRTLVHAPACRRPDVRERSFPDRPGWVFGRCSTCGESGWRQEEQAPLAPPAPVSRYVCAEHHEPVTWRGTGCTACAADRDRRGSAPQEPVLPRAADSGDFFAQQNFHAEGPPTTDLTRKPRRDASFSTTPERTHDA